MIAVIDYGVGNLFSVEKAMSQFGSKVEVSADEGTIRKAEKIVLPGVGAFGDCMNNLVASGLIPVLKDMIGAGYPVLGICVGLQIMFEGSEESPGVQGLGIFSGMVHKIEAPNLKVPHMGWNSLEICASQPKLNLFLDLPADPYVYFVHSYAAQPTDAGIITSYTEYGSKLTASVASGNVQAVQFHPEKSGDVGLHILENFVKG